MPRKGKARATARDMKLIREYVTTGNVTRAAAAVGVARETASRALHGHLAPLVVEAYARAGITMDAVAERIHDALGATRVVIVPDGQGGGHVQEVVDHRVRLRAAEVALDVLLRLADLSAANERARQEQERALSRAELEGLTAAQLIEVIRERERRAAGR